MTKQKQKPQKKQWIQRRGLAHQALTIANITHVNTARAKSWHGRRGLQSWNSLEWAGALCGEAGEAANVAKKLKRIDDRVVGNMKRPPKGLKPHNLRREFYVKKLAEECADVLLYTLLLAAREEIDLERAVVRKFNTVSRRYGFPQRLVA